MPRGVAADLTASGLEVDCDRAARDRDVAASSSREVLTRRAASERGPAIGVRRRRRRGAASSRLRCAERQRRHQSAVRARRRHAARRQDHRRGRAARRAVERHAVLGQGARARRRRQRPAAARRRRARGRRRSPSYLRLDDAVLEINVTPNRGDCFSVLGIARELAARRGTTVPGASRRRSRGRTIADTFPVALELPARAARGSPAACCAGSRRARGRRCGCANGCGAPACGRFNRSSTSRTTSCSSSASRCTPTISPSSIAASRRGLRAPASTSRCSTAAPSTLADDMLVIADARGPVGLAGVMGGKYDRRRRRRRTRCSSRARSSRPARSSGRARRIGLHTDASLRFERGVDPAGQARAIERATELLLAICGGARRPGHVSVERSATCRSAHRGTLRRERLRAVLGARRPGRPKWPRSCARLEMQVASSARRLAGDAAVVPVRHRDRGRSHRGGRPHGRLRRASRRRPAAWSSGSGVAERDQRRRPIGSPICSSPAATPRPSPTASSTPSSRPR